MARIIHIDTSDICPVPEDILASQGIKPGTAVKPKVVELSRKACRLYEQLVAPRGLMMDISREEFETVYHGQGRNDSPGPIEEIYPRAYSMALFAVTSGPVVSKRISQLFKKDDFVLGSLLDTAASLGTDLAARRMERQLSETMVINGHSAFVLGYSPGYCGWHVSAQRALFDLLRPERIGITLRESFLMEPLKSISGVLLAGPPDIHLFDNTYTFCGQCQTQSCLLRMKSIGVND